MTRAGLGLLLLSGLLASAACSGDAPTGGDGALAIGEVVDLSLALEDGRRTNARVELRDILGSRATVLIGWSVPCPCVEAIEERVQQLMRAYPASRGVRFAAIDGEPADTREQIREKLLRLDAPYVLLFDPDQDVTRRLGIGTATEVVVLDGEGRIRYRGALDGDLAVGKAQFAKAALDAVLAGDPPPFVEKPLAYGCAFGEPAEAERLGGT